MCEAALEAGGSEAQAREGDAMKRGLGAVLVEQEVRLADAERSWTAMIERVRSNPNQLNVDGIWMDEWIADVTRLRAIILARKEVVRELRMHAKVTP